MPSDSPALEQALSLARASAVRYKHSHVTPEHILLGLLESGDATALKRLSETAATPDQIKVLVQQHIRPGEFDIPAEQLSYSERAKRVLEASRVECAKTQSEQVSPEHALAALASVRNTVAGAVLAAIDFR